MSVNQSRGERTDSAQYKKLGRSGSSGQQWNPSGGRGGGGGGTAHPPSSVNPSFSTNRSFKNPNNAQRVQPRAGSGGVKFETEFRPAARPQQNGAHPVPAQQGTADVPIGGVAIKSAAEMPAQRSAGVVTNAQSSQPAARNSEATLPTTPAKASGDASKSFPLQFGSISPGFVNGMQIPARTNSAPPNLDEQKHDQFRHPAVRPVMIHPVPSVPKPQTSRKVGVAVNQSNNDDSHQISKARRESQVSAALHMPQAQKSPVHSMPGVPMSMAYHPLQPQVQFGGHGSLIPSQAAMPMQIQMPLSMGNPSQHPQQMFLSSHQMVHQGLMHQGQSLNFAQQMNPQLGNLGMGMGAQFIQQPSGNTSIARKPIKITHPDTREELRLDESVGSKLHSSAPHTLPTSTMPIHTLNYYPGTYSSSSLLPGSIPMNNTQIAPSSQPPRFVYPVSQGTQSVTFTNPSHTQHSNKNNNQMHGIAEPSATHHVTVKPGSLLHTVKADSPAAIGSTYVDKFGSLEISQQAGEVNSFHSQRESVAHQDSFLLPLKPVLDPKISSFPATVEQPKGISSLPIQETASAVANDDSRSAEVVDRSGPPKNLQNENNNGGQSPTHQVSTQSTSISDLSSQSLHQSASVANGPTVAMAGEKVNASNGSSENYMSYSASFPRLSGSSDSSCIELNDSVAVDGLTSGNNARKVNLTVHTEPEKLESIDNKEQLVGIKEESKQDINDSDLSLDSVSPRSAEVASQSEFHNAKKIEEFERVDKSSFELMDSTISVDLAPVSESSLNSEGDGSPTASSPKEERPVAELSRTKSLVSKSKKKRKEILQKADAVGASSDLYNAYKAPSTPSEGSENTPSDLKQNQADGPQNDMISIEKVGQSKSEPDNWEDVADISTPKLVLEGELVDKKHVNGLSSKKYSRDFLLTLSEHNTDLPYGFDINEIGGDIFTGSNANNFRDSYPSPGRNGDRGGHRTGGAPVRDARQDNYGNARPGQGGNYGVLRNPRTPAGPYGGGILNGPMMQPTISLQRNNSESDRWQRSSSQKGLIPSPQTPMQVMHKAEKKYEVGIVTDEEQVKQRQLKAILNKLTPQNFEKLFQQVKDVNIDNANTLAGVISQIFDKALTEPTFCEMYADFCFHLSRELPDFSEDNEKITFKRLLLSKCQEEFERGEREQEEANKADEEGEVKLTKEEREEKSLKARRRMLGNIRLIGELYKKKMLTERIMHECIKKLLGQYQTPDEEDIEALCKLMSTIGEMIDHQKAKEHIDAYFERMSTLSVNMKLSSRVRFMLKDSIDLRRNKWQQRRKVEGPKKIEEVHRDAANERQVQASRLARGPPSSNSSVRGRQMDYSPRPTPMLGGFRSTPQQQQQQRGYMNQDFRTEERNQYENRTTTLPLPQRSFGDNSLTLGPQGGLARGMSIKGQNNSSTEGSRRLGVGPNGSDRSSSASREDLSNQTVSDRIPYEHPNMADRNIKNGNRDSRSADGPPVISSPIVLTEERLQAMSKSTIREFYSAKDMKEVLQCVKDLNTPTFYPNMISLWVMDSFERKDVERALLTQLLTNLSKSQGGILSHDNFIKGFELILSSLEDAVNDAPKAAEFLGCIFATIILENVVSFTEIGQLVFHGGEEPGSLVETGLAAEVVATVMETISSVKGESVLNEIRTGSSLKVEQFRNSDPKKSRRLDKFI